MPVVREGANSKNTNTSIIQQPAMYRSMYGGGGKSNVSEISRTVSLDEGLSGYNDDVVSGSALPVSHAQEEEKASEYINKIFGEDLGVLLAECAVTKPEDPILLLADLLERLYFPLYLLDNKYLYAVLQ